MEIYEYKVKRVSVSIWRGDEDLVRELKVHGLRGWELISTNYHWWYPGYDLFFKRIKKVRDSDKGQANSG
jgi:hypothetical protein